MAPKSSVRKRSSKPGDCDPTQSTVILDDAREPPVASRSVSNPRAARLIESTEMRLIARQSEILPIIPELEDQVHQTTNSSGQSSCNDSLEQNSEGRSSSRSLWDASGRVPIPQRVKIGRKSTVGDACDSYTQSEVLLKVSDLEDHLDQTNSKGQSIPDKGRLEMNSAGPSFPYNSCDGSRGGSVSKNDISGGETIPRGEKAFVCVICEKAFRHKYQLKRHGIIHTGEKPFKCTECGKLFARKGNLNKHLLVHSKCKLFCDFCNKPFSLPCSLERHILSVHLEVISVACGICKKTFPRTVDMQQHKRGHVGEKPYECEVCNLKFSRDSYLNRHRRIIHSDIIWID